MSDIKAYAPTANPPTATSGATNIEAAIAPVAIPIPTVALLRAEIGFIFIHGFNLSCKYDLAKLSQQTVIN